MALRLGDGHGIGNLERKLKSLPLTWLPCILRPKQYPGYQCLSAAVISAEDFAPQKPLFDLQDQKLGTITETTDLVQIAGEHDDAVFFQMQFMRRDSRRIQGVEVVSLKPVLNIFVHGAICAINDGRILVKLRQAPLVDVIYISIRAGENGALGSLLVVAICDGEISENFLDELLFAANWILKVDAVGARKLHISTVGHLFKLTRSNLGKILVPCSQLRRTHWVGIQMTVHSHILLQFQNLHVGPQSRASESCIYNLRP